MRIQTKTQMRVCVCVCVHIYICTAYILLQICASPSGCRCVGVGLLRLAQTTLQRRDSETTNLDVDPRANPLENPQKPS